MKETDPPRRWRRISLHLLRVALFAVIMALIHLQHKQLAGDRARQPLAPVDVETLRRFYPDAQTVAPDGQGNGRRDVHDAADNRLGYVLQTSPGSDHLLGFSGPTNTLIAFDTNDRIVGIDVLSSGDTREHVAQVLQDQAFMNAFNGLAWEEAAAGKQVDAVTGATLTSLTIQESIVHRLSGGRQSLRFPDPPAIDDVRVVFESADSVEQDQDILSLWYVRNVQGHEMPIALTSVRTARPSSC